MTTSTQFAITHIETAQAQKEVTMNEAINRIDSALAAASPYAPDNAVNLTAAGGLSLNRNYGWLAGAIRQGNVIVTTSRATVTCTASATSYIEVDAAGAVSANTTGFTAGRFPLAIVVCDATKKTSITDRRAWLAAPNNPILAKSVAGGSTVTLTSAEARHDILSLTGALTANIDVVVPVINKQWTVANLTSGAYTLTVKTSAGTGITIAQGTRAIVYCDGTNVVRATADV